MKRYRGESLIFRVPFLFPATEAVFIASILFFANHPWIAGAAMAAVIATFALATRSAHVEVGLEGVSVEWMGWRRFFPRSDIAKVAVYESGFPGRHRRTGVMLTLEGGATVKIPIADESAGVACRAIRDTLEVDASDASAAATVALARGDLTMPEWLSRLRRVGAEQPDGVRGGAVPRDQLWGVVSDPTAAAGERAAAAVALRMAPAPTDDTKPRLLRIATETVDPELRVVLERAGADGSSEQEIEEAFLELAEKTREA